MLQMRTFMSKTTQQALEYGDQHINEWLMRENAKVVSMNQSFGTIEAKTGAREGVIFITIWFEKPEKGASGTMSASAASHATASAPKPAASTAAEPILDLEPEA